MNCLLLFLIVTNSLVYFFGVFKTSEKIIHFLHIDGEFVNSGLFQHYFQSFLRLFLIQHSLLSFCAILPKDIRHSLTGENPAAYHADYIQKRKNNMMNPTTFYDYIKYTISSYYPNYIFSLETLQTDCNLPRIILMIKCPCNHTFSADLTHCYTNYISHPDSITDILDAIHDVIENPQFHCQL